jgi:hypothetical protein
MAKDSDQLVVAAFGTISVAPVGTTVETNPNNALAAAFRDLGYATEDGVTFGDSPSVEAIMGWQKSSPLRRIVTGRDRTVGFTLHQWNDATLPFVYGGGEWNDLGSGIYRFDPPADTDALVERCLVVDWQDGARNFRFVAYNGSVTGGVETQLTRTGSSVLPVTFEINANDNGDDWNIFSDDPVFVAGGS